MKFPWMRRSRRSMVEHDVVIADLSRNLAEVETMMVAIYRGFAEQRGWDFDEGRYRMEIRSRCNALKSDVIQEFGK